MKYGFCILLVGLLSCPDNANASEADEALIRAQLVEIATMTETAGSVEKVNELYLEYFSAVPTLLPPDGDPIHGRTAIAEFYDRAFEGIEIVSNRYRDPAIVVEGDMAVRRYVGTAFFKVTGEPEAMTATNRYLDVLLREDGDWKMVWHSWVPVTWD